MKDPIMMDGLGHSGATNAQLEAIRRAGQWMPWAGLGLAVVWWASVAVTVVTSVDRTQFAEAGALSIMAAIALAAVPGLVVLFAGYVAREGARRNAASSLILKAATQLLNPSKAYGDEAQTLAASLKASSEDIDQAMETALSAMRSVSSEMGDERLRLESVTYAAADNARDLAARLADERAALETLTRDLREQADQMGETIPRQAAAMVDAARSASVDLAQSDQALEQRLQALKRTGSQITDEFAKIDGMAHTLQKQGDTLVFAVSRLETRLEEAQKTVEDTMRAGDVAGDVAGQTGDALKAAVDSALEHARRLNAEINTSARQASDEATRAMADLRAAAERAAAAVEEARTNARQDGRLSDAKLGQVVDALNDAADGSPRAMSPAPRGRQAEPKAPAARPEPPRVTRPRAIDPAPERPVANGTAAPASTPAGPPPSRPDQPADGASIPRAVPAPASPVEQAARQGLNGRHGLNGNQGQPAEPRPAAQAALETDQPDPRPSRAEAEPPKPILPPPAPEPSEPSQTVMLTSTRAAGFAQPNPHVPMPSRLDGPGQGTGKGPAADGGETVARPASSGATGEKQPPRAALGATPVPLGNRAQSSSAPSQQAPSHQARSQAPIPSAPNRPDTPPRTRPVPRLDASPRELETELFGADDDLAPEPDAPTSVFPDRRTDEPIVDENIFHANPRDVEPDPGAPVAPAAEPRRQNGHAADAPTRQADLNARTARAPESQRSDPRDQVGPPPANVDVQPSLQPAPQPAPAPMPAPAAPSQAPAQPAPAAAPDRRGDADWSTILNDMDREDTGQLPREETAESVIQRLETSGIALSNIFRPKAKKKIAAAARKGEQTRRAAIVSAARTEVDRVAKRLVADPELAQLAEDFVAMEEPDAIAALDRTQKSGRNASPRLSAFLLLDAATSSQRPAA